MSDDRWRPEHRDETTEFGGPLFPDESDHAAADEADDADGDARLAERNGPAERRLRFGPDDTGPLPHWTAPPTGEIPRLQAQSNHATDDQGDDDSDDVDVWSTFTTESPVWRDDDPVTTVMEQVPHDLGPSPDERGRPARSQRDSGFGPPDDRTDDESRGGYPPDPRYGRRGSATRGDPGGEDAGVDDLSGEVPTAARREPGRITIGTDPSTMPPRRQPEPMRRRQASQRTGRPVGPARTAAPQPRNMGNAAVAGGVIAAAFVIALMIRPVVVLVLICIVLGLAAWEYLAKITEKGYRPAVAPGLAACVFAPLAAYWMGSQALPLVIALAFVAGAAGFVGAHGVESGPLPNMAVTTMGVVWIGLFGSYAALILRMSNGWIETMPGVNVGSNNGGTDILFMVALGVALNDIGALVVGSAVGKSPLRSWVSPSKTVEGLVGGTLATFLALWIASMLKDDGSAFKDFSDLLLLVLVISVLAPLGDLTESMFKRNLDIKDFGTIVQGHGGVLDRFDSYLFVLPGAYYLSLILYG